MRAVHLHDSIYEANVVLLVGPLRELGPWLTRRGYPTNDDDASWSLGKTEELTTPKGSAWIIWLPPHPSRSTIAHECVHVTAQVLRDRDVTLTRASEEAYAYYVSAMFDQIVRALARFRARSTPPKKKKRARV